ncbi:MAG TPA: cyclopropane-fatty-acyl-phospholipid synthase family protein [Kiritimatiellia bacterium]|nr:cyclopropane-fatty-acyl-phospholipid synthase family protein [Kiritimatiellia bacterium]
MNAWPLIEKEWIPDFLLRRGIRRLLAQRLEQEAARAGQLDAFIAELKSSPIAIHTQDANQQHYEVPTAYFKAALGPRLKYSSCLWDDQTPDLAAAEERMLALTCERAQLAPGQDILELGCGWGSLSLYMAERFPAARVTAVSNSRTQKEYIDAEAKRRGLTNLTIITSDMNDFATDARFDRVVSVEMFEHMRNYEELLRRIRGWLKPDGRLFVHIFCHERFAYPFETDGDNDWMARYFFTGGIMPSFDLLSRFDRDLVQIDAWKVNGVHYARTLEAWLQRQDTQRATLWPLFVQTYGADHAQKWWVYWRLFYLACAELFAYRGGAEWYVGHYLFKPRARSPDASSGAQREKFLQTL